MPDSRLAVILKFAQIVNPQVKRDRVLKVDLNELRQLPSGTLGNEVARFLDSQEFELIESGDWIQRTHDVWHVVTGLSASQQDEFLLQAFTRSLVFRPSSAILVVFGLLTRQCRLGDVIRSLKYRRLAQHLINWDIESDWETPLSEVRRKLGIVPLKEVS